MKPRAFAVLLTSAAPFLALVASSEPVRAQNTKSAPTAQAAQSAAPAAPAAPNAAPTAPAAPAAPVPPAAPAAPVNLGEDEVALKNGGMLRGTIIAIEPEKHVVMIVAPLNEQRSVPWAEVDKVERGKYKATPAEDKPAKRKKHPKDAPEAPVAPSQGAPLIHIETDNPNVTLNHVVTAADAIKPTTQTKCQAPCDKVVDGTKGGEFFFGGEGVAESSRFQLGDKNGRVIAHVDPSGKGTRMGGVLLTGFGGLATAGGLALIILSIPKCSGECGAISSDGYGLMKEGGAIMGIGAAAIVGGVLLVMNAKTTYTLASKKPAPTTGIQFREGRFVF